MSTCIYPISLVPRVTCGDETEGESPLCEFHFEVMHNLMTEMGVTDEDLEPPNGIEWTEEDVRKLQED